MRILGIDPGYERLGIAVIEIGKQGGAGKKEVLLFSECFKTSREATHEIRLKKVGRKIREIISEWKPEEVAIEELFFNINQKTALLVAQAFGVIIYEAAEAGLPVSLYGPLQVKIATTGYGRSSKEQIQEMVARLIDIKRIMPWMMSMTL